MMVFTFLIPVRSGHGPHLNFSLLQTVIRGACGEVNQVTAAERSHFQISAHTKKNVRLHVFTHLTPETVRLSPIKKK